MANIHEFIGVKLEIPNFLKASFFKQKPNRQIKNFLGGCTVNNSTNFSCCFLNLRCEHNDKLMKNYRINLSIFKIPIDINNK